MSGDDTLVREMGCTEADFMRWLPGATRHAPVQSRAGDGESSHTVLVAQGRVEILLRPLPERRIAGMVLPVLGVTFRFVGLTPEERTAFLTYFDHYTRRGGG